VPDERNGTIDDPKDGAVRNGIALVLLGSQRVGGIDHGRPA
jgi:hypothetical protein